MNPQLQHILGSIAQIPDFQSKHSSPVTKGSSSTTAGKKDALILQALVNQSMEESKKSQVSSNASGQDHPVKKHSSKGLADLIAESRSSGLGFAEPQVAVDAANYQPKFASGKFGPNSELKQHLSG